MYTSLPRGVPRCHHVRVNGTRCDSPALKAKAYCYFHYRSRLEAAAGSPKANSQELHPAGIPLNPEPLLLEDANSIQCALQWVLRRILAASIDRRQASLLLYGLQIAASNVKQTSFEPFHWHVIRDLPAPETAEPQATEPTKIAHEVAETAHESAENCPNSHPEPAPLKPADRDNGGHPEQGASEPADSNNGCHPELGPGEPIPVRANGPAFSSQLSTALRRPKRPSRRARSAPVTLDRQMLSSSPRAALSLMFQREVKRHLARLDFPNSPDADPAEKLTADT
ncbi:MAG TPA: hypothetical protein VFK81_21520 [Terriglobales bacterium]|nr:hypothetical protein [Terriglobales bacterium]